MKFDTEIWFEGQTEVHFIPSKAVSEEYPISAVKIFDITDGSILMVEVPEKGGWDIPGGHVEEGETPIDAAKREVSEETNGRVNNLSLFGYLMMKKVIETPENKNYPYQSAIAMFTGDISNTATDDSTLAFEAVKLGYYELNHVAEVSPFWTKLSQQILEYAATSSA